MLLRLDISINISIGLSTGAISDQASAAPHASDSDLSTIYLIIYVEQADHPRIDGEERE
jgi:hypothetical protein